MGIALAAAVAGRLHVHQPRVLAVLHVADQDAVLDQHGAVGRRALVVDRERTAPRGHGAVIDHGDALGRDLLAHQPCEGRRLLAVEIALQPVADRLMQHHAGPAGAEHHVHLAGRRRHRFQIDHGLADRAIGRLAPRFCLDEARIAFAPAVPSTAALLPVALAGDDGNIDAHQRPDVAIALAVGADDFDHLPGRAEADRHLPHPRILVADVSVDLGQQLYLGFEPRRIQRIVVAIKSAHWYAPAPPRTSRHSRRAPPPPHPPPGSAPAAKRRRNAHTPPRRPSPRAGRTPGWCRKWPASAAHCRTSALRSAHIPGTARHRQPRQAPAPPRGGRHRGRDWRDRAGRLWRDWSSNQSVVGGALPR